MPARFVEFRLFDKGAPLALPKRAFFAPEVIVALEDVNSPVSTKITRVVWVPTAGAPPLEMLVTGDAENNADRVSRVMAGQPARDEDSHDESGQTRPGPALVGVEG